MLRGSAGWAELGLWSHSASEGRMGHREGNGVGWEHKALS